MPQSEFAPLSRRAHELYGYEWINGDPVIVSAMQGYVLLLAFWDYAGLTAETHLRYANAWTRKYEAFDLVVVGVHTPRYAFERDHAEASRIVGERGLRFPIMFDDAANAVSQYNVRSLPAFVAIDRNGFVRGTFEGDVNFTAVERLLQGLLHEAGRGGDLPELMEPISVQDREHAGFYHQTPEFEVGYLRGSLGNVEGYIPESTVDYADPGIYLDGRAYLEGVWSNRRECLTLESPEGGSVILQYQGLDVSAILGGTEGVIVRQDGEYLTVENKGADATLNADGRSVLRVDRTGCYNIVKNPDFGGHTLRLTTDRPGFEAYAFSFTSDIVPEMIARN